MLKVVWDQNFKMMRTQVERTVIAQIEKVLVQSVGNIRCKEHDKDPAVLVSGKGLDKLEFQVQGCCDELIEKVEAKLANL
jgi:hypothetical protein